MSLLQTAWFLLVLMLGMGRMRMAQSQTNQYKTSITNGTYRWESITEFIPVQSESFGSIPIGEIMHMEFDFVWWGRTNDPQDDKFEMFFRVGFDSSGGAGCNGQGARYPSFWLTNTADTLHVSVSEGTSCQPSQSLNEYGVIPVGVPHHISIYFNTTTLLVTISGGNKPFFTVIWDREPTQPQYIGVMVPVWWMSNKVGDFYNRGSATFTNVVLTSFTPTIQPTLSPTLQPTNIPTLIPSVSPTLPPSVAPSISPLTLSPTTHNPSYPPSMNPATNIPTTAAPTTTSPSITPSLSPSTIPTYTPSVDPTNNPTLNPSLTPSVPPTNMPTNIPTFIPSVSPSYTPTNIPTISSIPPTIIGYTYSPTTEPSIYPTRIPSLHPTINPTMEPTIHPTVNPTLMITQSTIISTENEYSTTEKPSRKPTFGYRPFTTTTPFVRTIPDHQFANDTTTDSYQYVEITIFSTVIALCFCTVFSFLAYLTFKRKVNNLKKKRNQLPLAKSPKYHLELNGMGISTVQHTSSESKSENKTYKLKINNQTSPRKNALISPSKTISGKFLRSPSKTKTAPFESVYLTLGQYKSDSRTAPPSHLSISVMNNNDVTPTPAVSPVEEKQNKPQTTIIRHYTPVTPDHKQRDIQTVGFQDDSGSGDSSDYLYEKDVYDQKTRILRTGDEDHKYDVIHGQVKREKKKFTPKAQEVSDNGMNEASEPYEEYVEHGGYGLYTTPMIKGYGRYRKGTENTEGYGSEHSDATDNIVTNFFSTYDEEKHSKKKYYKGNGYEWIRKTLMKVDKQYYKTYLANFEKHKVEDNRLRDLLADDWSELIPEIGPRNHFKRLYERRSGYSEYFLGEFEYDKTTTASGSVPESLSKTFEEEKNSADEEILFTPSKSDEYYDNVEDHSKLTFNDIKKKYGNYIYDRHAKKAQELNGNKNESMLVVADSQISECNEEKEEKYEFKSNINNNRNALHPLKSTVSDEEAPINNNRLRPMNTMLSPSSPPISPPQYTGYKAYDNHNIITNKKRKLRKLSKSKSKSSVVSDISSSIAVPIPNDIDPKELEKAFDASDINSDDSDDLIGIPKFEADVDSGSETQSESDSDSESESDSESDSEEDVDEDEDEDGYAAVDIINEIYEEEEYEAVSDDDDDDSVSIDLGKSSSEDMEYEIEDEYYNEDD